MKQLILRSPIITDEQALQNYVRSTILSDLNTLNGDNDIREVRILSPKGVWSGYFDDMEKLCEAVLPFNGVHNIFTTLNSVTGSVVVTNRVQKVKNTTKDSGIAERGYLFLDIDPERPSKTSATDEEQRAAYNTAVEVEGFLTAHGFPSPVLAMSGNGFHLLYKIDMDNDCESYELIKSFLEAMAVKFSNEKAKIDNSVYKAAQLTKLYGTMAVKGEDTAERSHRMSKIIDVPETIGVVTAEQIQAVTALLMPTQAQPATTVKLQSVDTGKSGKKYDIEAFINEQNIEVVVTVKETPDYKLWRIVCPFCGDKDAFIQQFNNGAINARCHHDKCEWGWKELRAKFDPVYAKKLVLRQEAAEIQLPEHLVPYNDLLIAEKPNMYIDSGGNIQILQGGSSNPYWAKLANFVSVPLEIIYEIDGTDDNAKNTLTKIGGWLEGTTELKPITIDTDKLFRGRWFIELDFRASLNSEIRGGQDKIREIVQIFSPNATQTTIYNHLGFRTIDGKRCFLHAKGAIGLENVSVNLPHNLAGYEFEDISGISAEDKTACIRMALKLFGLHKYGNVLFAYTFLPPLCDMFAKQNNMPSFSLWLHGKSDTGKSTVAALLLNFFGKDFSKNSLPMNFNDTENSLTKKLSLCKDVLSVIDDMVHPTVIRNDMNKQKKLAQDLIFNIANRKGRGRMKCDESLKKTPIPNGMVVFTAEYPLDNISESTTARLLCVEFEKSSVNLNVLTECQKNKLSLNRTMTGFIEWLIANADTLAAELQQRFEQLRADCFAMDSATDTSKKLIEVCAFMHIAMDCALQYFIEAGAVDSEYKKDILHQLDEDIQTLIEKQSAAIATTSPTKQFMDVIGNLFADGTIYTKEIGGAITGQTYGKNFVGWHDRNNYYFAVSENTGNIYVAVKQYYQKHDIAFEIQPKELYRRLLDEGIISKADKGRYTTVKAVDNEQHRVLVIPKALFKSGDVSAEYNSTFDDD